MKNWSRRKFLEKGVVSAIAVGGARFPQVMAIESGNLQPVPEVVGSLDLKLLSVVMDELIPEDADMPSASEAGCLQYLSTLASRNSGVVRGLIENLEKLNALSLKLDKQSFTQITSQKRTRLLEIFESRDRQAFEVLRNLVYEAYYTQPKVWQLIGYEPHPTNEPGPTMAFDETVLAAVRKKSRHYREV